MKEIEAPFVDFSLQLSLDKRDEHVELCIFDKLKDLAVAVSGGAENPIGVIVVLGNFERLGQKIMGMVQMKPKQNPVESVILIDSPESIKKIIEFSRAPFDGAVVINRNGQILGAGIYLIVDNPLLEIPEDCGTRHKAAASFSERNEVTSVLTLSEETNTVRIWKDGRTKDLFRVDKI